MKRLYAASIVALVLSGSGCSDSDNSSAPADNQAPTISAVMDASLEANSVDVPFDFTVDDDSTGAGSLTVSVDSDNADLFTDEGLVLEGSADSRTLLVTPAPASIGSATLTLSVTDDAGLSADSSFMITVLPQPASFNATVRTAFGLGENADPQTINDKEFNDDSTDFNDLVGG